jgi:hypothetical protein
MHLIQVNERNMVKRSVAIVEVLNRVPLMMLMVILVQWPSLCGLAQGETREKAADREYGVTVGQCSFGIGYPWSISVSWEVDVFCREARAASVPSDYHLQLSTLAPTEWGPPTIELTDEQGRPLGLNGADVILEPSDVVAIKAGEAFPAPEGKTWFGFQSTGLIPSSFEPQEVFFHISATWEDLSPGSNASGAIWLSDDADDLHGDTVTDALLETAPADPPTRLAFPWVSNSNEFESNIVVTNTGTQDANVLFRAQRADGSVEQTHPLILHAGNTLDYKAATLFPNLGLGPGYCVELSSDRAHISGRWVTNDRVNFSPSQGVAVTLNQSCERAGNLLVFDYLPGNSDFNSVPVVTNISTEVTAVEVAFYDGAGTFLGAEINPALAPMQPWIVRVLTQNDGNQYAVASSMGEPITGVAFVFNEEGQTAIGNATAISGNE